MLKLQQFADNCRSAVTKVAEDWQSQHYDRVATTSLSKRHPSVTQVPPPAADVPRAFAKRLYQPAKAILPRPMQDAIRLVANAAQAISRVPELERRDSITCIGKSRVGLVKRTYLSITALLLVATADTHHPPLPRHGTDSTQLVGRIA